VHGLVQGRERLGAQERPRKKLVLGSDLDPLTCETEDDAAVDDEFGHVAAEATAQPRIISGSTRARLRTSSSLRARVFANVARGCDELQSGGRGVRLAAAIRSIRCEIRETVAGRRGGPRRRRGGLRIASGAERR
jgi:hypothetical protein